MHSSLLWQSRFRFYGYKNISQLVLPVYFPSQSRFFIGLIFYFLTYFTKTALCNFCIVPFCIFHKSVFCTPALSPKFFLFIRYHDISKKTMQKYCMAFFSTFFKNCSKNGNTAHQQDNFLYCFLQKFYQFFNQDNPTM